MKRKTIDVYVGGGEVPNWCPLNNGGDIKKPQATERYDILPGGRLTTDDPTNNTQTMLNYAYAKDGRVLLRYGDGEEDIDLCEYISREAADKHCAPTPKDVMEGACFECDCPLAILYVIATQAAELRARLKEYEDQEEKKVPQKPHPKHTPSPVRKGVCPRCLSTEDESANYCRSCGQALDWGAANGKD
jgi:hypothetical protein